MENQLAEATKKNMEMKKHFKTKTGQQLITKDKLVPVPQMFKR